MKKSKIAIFALLLAFCTGLSAQAKFGWGVKVGANVDKMSFPRTSLTRTTVAVSPPVSLRSISLPCSASVRTSRLCILT